MTKQEEGRIFSDAFRKRTMQVAMNIRRDVGGSVFIFFGLSLAMFIELVFWMVAGVYGVSQYAEHLVATYPGFPVSETMIVGGYGILAVITKFTAISIWCWLTFYVLILAVTEREWTLQRQEIVPGHRDKHLLYAGEKCSHCGSTHTRPVGKSFKGGSKRYCKTCRKFY